MSLNADIESDGGTVNTWFAVRCILGTQPADAAETEPCVRYEERITLWRVETFDAAIALAETEADEYCADVGCERLKLSQAFKLFDAPGHGTEVFSLMRDSDLSASDYLDRFFDTGRERLGDIEPEA